MASSLSPQLASIIMVGIKKKVIKPLINDNTIKFYVGDMQVMRYVGDTLHVVKRKEVRRIQNPLNSFDPNLSLTEDLLQNEVPHFPDL